MRTQGNTDTYDLNYFLTDQVNSTSKTVKQDGSVSTIRYKAWGETRTSTGTVPTDRKYTGQIEDEAGLYFYNARWYDPLLGRFAQADTVTPNPLDTQSWNRYTYSNNNPVIYVDPSGHVFWLGILALGGAIIGAGADYIGQVVNNYENNGGDLGAAMTTNIDLASIGNSAIVGSAVGVTIGVAGPVALGFAGDAIAGVGLLRGSTQIFGWGMTVTGASLTLANAMMGVSTNTTNTTNTKYSTNSRGELTNGKYTVDNRKMANHLPGSSGEGKSIFSTDIDANSFVLDGASMADQGELWNNANHAYIEFDMPIGSTYNGNLTNWMTVTRTTNGYIQIMSQIVV